MQRREGKKENEPVGADGDGEGEGTGSWHWPKEGKARLIHA